MLEKVISFELLKLQAGKKKICTCNPPQYEIDSVNRIVICSKCGATIDAFDALLNLCNYTKKYEEYQTEALEKIKVYREMAEAELKRRIKNGIFKDMDTQYKNGMFPHCPECGKEFNPIQINRWSRKNDK